MFCFVVLNHFSAFCFLLLFKYSICIGNTSITRRERYKLIINNNSLDYINISGVFFLLIIAPINDIFLVSIFFQTTSKHYNNMKISIKAAVLMLLITDFSGNDNLHKQE